MTPLELHPCFADNLLTPYLELAWDFGRVEPLGPELWARIGVALYLAYLA